MTDDQPKVVVGGEQGPVSGQVVTPSAAPDPTPTPVVSTEEPQVEILEPNQQAVQPTEPTNFDQPISGDSNVVTWTASEFIAHEKSSSWYAALAGGALAAAILAYLVTKDMVTSAVIIVAGVMLGVYGSHQPRQLQYQLDLHGITIGNKHYGYEEFRSFSVIPEGAFSSIVFMPMKRFAPPTTIYYAPEDEDRIITLLSNYLPFEQQRRDAVDSLMRRIRF
jgi:hypothetical protein